MITITAYGDSIANDTNIVLSKLNMFAVWLVESALDNIALTVDMD